MLLRLASLVPVAAFILGGCGCDAGGGTPTPAAVASVPNTPATLHIEIGTGASSFEPIADQATIAIVHGAQGGQHVLTSVRLNDDGFDTVSVNLSSRFADTGAPAGEPSGWIARLSTPMDGTRTHAGMQNDVAPLAGPRAIVVRIEVVAPDGSHGSDERTVVVTP